MVAKNNKVDFKPVYSQQATTRTDRGHKRPSPELERMLKLVNLVPAGRELPDLMRLPEGFLSLSADEIEQLVSESFSALPDELAVLRAHLLDQMMQPNENDWLRAQSIMPRWPPQLQRVFNAIALYGEIRRCLTTFRAIARREPFISIEVQGIPDWGRGTFRVVRDRLAIELDKIDIRYIRVCVICGRVYLAPRLTYKGGELKHCGEKCARAVRNKRYQANRPPACLQQVDGALKRWKRLRSKTFMRTTKNVADLAEWAGCTIKQTNHALDFRSARNVVKK